MPTQKQRQRATALRLVNAYGEAKAKHYWEVDQGWSDTLLKELERKSSWAMAELLEFIDRLIEDE